MDIDRFTARVRNPALTRNELEQMRVNAAAKNVTEFVRVVDEVLRERFPNRYAKKGGGKTPTDAVFHSHTEHFESGRDAYLWLVNQFCLFHNQVLTQYDQLHTRAGSRSRGKRFSRDPQSLFPAGSSRRGDPIHYAPVGDGWYADINLNHADKFAQLVQLSQLANLEYERDWEFNVLGATEKLKEDQKQAIRDQKYFHDLFLE